MQRPSVAPLRRNTMRPPPPVRPSSSRTLSAAHPPSGRISPAESIASIASKNKSPTHNGTKRKERDFEQDACEETNINVVVRCRGRSEREVRENSGVVVSTDGVRGKAVELSMGPSALSNKTYNFDKVFSSAADQGMVFDEVVSPICDEVLSGFNCTIFAYGQTGTGKTYTMSGDIADILPQPDAAGIIPRVLHYLFNRLEKEDTMESNVKCSFIELYNEELRDLLAADESVKLKIYDETDKKGPASTKVQGMEEHHIKSASKGLGLLRDGSHKRQVAATKCNDLSSRSHTVFTVTVYMKRTSDTGEELVSAGKLNLVDLAGSENIQRSGAENKRAAEAGLINKSLLTLGRVINSLVEKQSHIPYRESKLTRLLQDSLGGRTKTCIIATLSPAKSNLEETISTLDYAFRAKNIRNKPQMNQLMTKKTLLREFTAEIEKLKSELIATRQRNGVYLTAESYEEITVESESRRILSEEQRDRIETMEGNLRNKAQELFALTNAFSNLRKDNEAVQHTLDGTQDVLKKTEAVLANTEESLREETVIRKAHQMTEEELARVGGELISTLGQTTADIGGLHSKIRRKSDLQSLNRTRWASSQSQVSDVTSHVQQRMKTFEEQHAAYMDQLSARMTSYLEQELAGLTTSQSLLADKVSDFERAEAEVNSQTGKARDDMNEILGGITTLKEDVATKVGNGLDGLSDAAKRISAGVVSELDRFHSQLHSSYSSLGKDFKYFYDDLVKQLNHQRAEADTLRQDLKIAAADLAAANERASAQLTTVLSEEKEQAASERLSLISQMTALIQSNGEVQERRLESKIHAVQEDIQSCSSRYNDKHQSFESSMDAWSSNDKKIVDNLLKSRETIKNKIKKDWTAASEQTGTIKTTTNTVHDETVSIVDAQKANLVMQLRELDEIISKVRDQNTKHHDAHVESLAALGSSVKQSYASIGDHFVVSNDRARRFEVDFKAHASALSGSLTPLDRDVKVPLTDLRESVAAAPLVEYGVTGETPQKQQYQYQTNLPRTEPHEELLKAYRGHPSHLDSTGTVPSIAQSPSKATVYNDAGAAGAAEPVSETSSPSAAKKASRPASSHSSLRELDANIVPATKADVVSALSDAKTASTNGLQPPLKRQNTGLAAPQYGEREVKDFSASIGSKLPKRATAEGRENMPLSASVGPGGRQLRSRGS